MLSPRLLVHPGSFEIEAASYGDREDRRVGKPRWSRPDCCRPVATADQC